MKLKIFIPALVLIAACGGGEPADSGSGQPAGGSTAAAPPAAAGLPAAPTGPMTMPDWYSVDEGARTVAITLTAGQTNLNNYWNYNGATKGDLAITVPEGYTVSITLVNQDPNMPHSVSILNLPENFMMPPAANPVFEGAMTENPTSMVEATMPGETETIQFVADEEGTYGIVCLIPGHSAIGMWLYFNVSDDGEMGVQTR